MNMQELLTTMIEKGASDMHLTVGTPPQLRVDGRLVSIRDVPLMPAETKQLCYSILTESQKHKFESEMELDLSFGLKGVSRFRANMFLQRGSVAGAFRAIPHKVSTFQELGLPVNIMRDMVKRSKGLILVTGPTGSGKSTTLASIVEEINSTRYGHIITIEDPIEFVHNHKKCIINQREVGADTKGFQPALKYILRQDPDVVLIGELRDLETIQSAVTVAETGHLVLATLHTNSCVQTINRILDVFPPFQQPQVRAQLSMVLEGVFCQDLIPRASGRGRVLAVELMIPNPAIRNLIREEKIHQMYSQMQVGQGQNGMQTMNQSLLALYQRGWITWDEALRRSHDQQELERMLGSEVGKGKIHQKRR